MNKLTLTAVIGTLVISSSALAQDDRPADRMESLDSNADGVISYEEFEVRGISRFAALDGNGDNQLSIEEFAVSMRPPRPRHQGEEQENNRDARSAQREQRMLARLTEQFDQTDTDGDGVLSSIEFVETGFLRLDADNNGSINADELRGSGRPGPRGGPGSRRN